MVAGSHSVGFRKVTFFFLCWNPHLRTNQLTGSMCHIHTLTIEHLQPIIHTLSKVSKSKQKEDRAVQTKVDSFFFSVNIKALS